MKQFSPCNPVSPRFLLSCLNKLISSFMSKYELTPKVGANTTQSKHEETGPKTKTSLCSDFWGCSARSHTTAAFIKVKRFRGGKAHLEEPMTQGCRISGNTLAVFFPRVSTLEMLSPGTCICV